MSLAGVRVEKLSKCYRIGARRRSSDSLKEALTDGARRVLRGGRRTEANWRPLWALRDVSFEVNEGEAVGIIAAVAVAGVLLGIVTSGPVHDALLNFILMVIRSFAGFVK